MMYIRGNRRKVQDVQGPFLVGRLLDILHFIIVYLY